MSGCLSDVAAVESTLRFGRHMAGRLYARIASDAVDRGGEACYHPRHNGIPEDRTAGISGRSGTPSRHIVECSRNAIANRNDTTIHANETVGT